MARVVVGNPFENQIGTVGATASPVDTYVRPAVQSSPFTALADTLKRLKAKADPMLDAQLKRSADREFAQGQELYNQTRTSIGDAVKAGLIAEGESPYLRKGYRISNLNALSARYTSDLNNALIAQKLYTNGNPASIDAFALKFYTDFEAKNGITDGFTPTETSNYFSDPALKANEAFRASWREKHTAWQAEQQYNALSNEVSAISQNYFKPTDTASQKAIKVAGFGKWIQGKVNQAEVDGMDRSKVNATIIDSVILTALEQNNPNILGVLDNIKVGSGNLGSTIDARNSVRSARISIAATLASNDVAKARADKDASDTLMANAMNAAIGSSTALRVSKGDAGAIESFNNSIKTLQDMGEPEASAKAIALINFRDAMISAGEKESITDRVTYAGYVKTVLDASTIDEAMTIVTRGAIDGDLNDSEMNTLLNMWDKLSNNNSIERLDILNTSIGIQSMITDFTNQIYTGTTALRTGKADAIAYDARRQVEYEYLNQMEVLQRANPDKTFSFQEKRALAQSIIEDLRKVYLNSSTLSAGENLLKTNAEIARLAQEAIDAAAMAAALEAAIPTSTVDPAAIPTF